MTLCVFADKQVLTGLLVYTLCIALSLILNFVSAYYILCTYLYVGVGGERERRGVDWVLV